MQTIIAALRGVPKEDAQYCKVNGLLEQCPECGDVRHALQCPMGFKSMEPCAVDSSGNSSNANGAQVASPAGSATSPGAAAQQDDTKRLDFVEKHSDGISVFGSGMADDKWFVVIYNDGNRAEGGTLRSAIDAAIKGGGDV